MLKEPKQVPKEPKMDTFQKYIQYFAYSINWFNMDAFEEGTTLPSINSFLLRICLDLNTSFLQSYRSIDFLNLSAQFVLLIISYLLVRGSYCFSILIVEPFRRTSKPDGYPRCHTHISYHSLRSDSYCSLGRLVPKAAG
jgi:hypothetical protein